MSGANHGFLGNRGLIWTLLARWLVPVMMAMAYAFMAATSETDATGQSWMGLGFVFVMVVWWIIRLLTSTAALSRAVAVGDAERILDITNRELTGRRRGRAKLLAARAYAFETRGDWDAALAAADEASVAVTRESAHDLAPRLAAIRVAALVETGHAADARPIYDASLARARGFDLDSISRLAAARIAWGSGDPATASPLLQRVIDDVRAGSFVRAGAHFYAARIADSQARPAVAARHRAEIAKLAPSSWLARPPAEPEPALEPAAVGEADLLG